MQPKHVPSVVKRVMLEHMVRRAKISLQQYLQRGVKRYIEMDQKQFVNK